MIFKRDQIQNSKIRLKIREKNGRNKERTEHSSWEKERISFEPVENCGTWIG